MPDKCKLNENVDLTLVSSSPLSPCWGGAWPGWGTACPGTRGRWCGRTRGSRRTSRSGPRAGRRTRGCCSCTRAAWPWRRRGQRRSWIWGYTWYILVLDRLSMMDMRYEICGASTVVIQSKCDELQRNGGKMRQNWVKWKVWTDNKEVYKKVLQEA